MSIYSYIPQIVTPQIVTFVKFLENASVSDFKLSVKLTSKFYFFNQLSTKTAQLKVEVVIIFAFLGGLFLSYSIVRLLFEASN